MLLIHEFTKKDLGKHYIKKNGEVVFLRNLIGYIQKIHIGKKLYKINGEYKIL